MIHKDDDPPISVVGYYPMIDASPTELSTVYTLLKHSIAMADEIRQEDVVIVMDQAIYAKAQEIIWSHPTEFSRVVLRMGAFHICLNLLRIIGKRFGEAGLADILVESGTVASGSVSGVLSGHHYNRAVRGHKIMYEAIQRQKWICFGSWMESSSEKILNQSSIKAVIDDLNNDFTADQFGTFIDQPEFANLLALYKEFESLEKGPMASYWQSYLDRVSLLLKFLRSTREGNWKLHLSCI